MFLSNKRRKEFGLGTIVEIPPNNSLKRSEFSNFPAEDTSGKYDGKANKILISSRVMGICVSGSTHLEDMSLVALESNFIPILGSFPPVVSVKKSKLSICPPFENYEDLVRELEEIFSISVLLNKYYLENLFSNLANKEACWPYRNMDDMQSAKQYFERNPPAIKVI